jgi:3-mercaptopyruvate sulfurtransferase SseA
MPTLNIPAGNSTISEPVSDEQLSGDRVTDIKKALEVSASQAMLTLDDRSEERFPKHRADPLHQAELALGHRRGCWNRRCSISRLEM